MSTIGVLISAHTPRLKNGMLERCLKSVLNQERPPDEIAVAIDHLGEGAAKTKQRALTMLTTEWVAVIDSDDEMLPHHLRIHEEAQLETGADLVYSWFETVPPGGDPFPEFFFTDPWNPESPRHTTTVVMVRRDTMMRVGYSAAADGIYEDDDWRLVLGLLAQGASVHHIADRSWLWHHHPQKTNGRAWK